jgi:hypothetical protein
VTGRHTATARTPVRCHVRAASASQRRCAACSFSR